MWEKVVAIIKGHQSFVLTSHLNPDGDALGSELALAEHLEALGKRVSIINSDAVPALYRFLDTQHRFKRFTPKKHNSLIQEAEVIIVLDASGGWERLGPVGQALNQAAGVKLCIDHHPDGSDFVDIAVIDTEAAATGELIYALIMAMSGSISKDMAQALYAALLTDTGSFRFPKTSPQTHHIAAGLLAAGVDPLYIYRRVYEQNSAGSVRLKGQVMASIQTAANGQVAYYGLGKDVLKHYKVKVSELDGIASLGQQIAGVRVSIFCMEASRGRVKISLRSDGSAAINQLALAYGGGGHPSAAGAIVQGKLDQIMAELVVKATALVKSSG